MKILKRLIGVILAVSMLTGLLMIPVSAEEDAASRYYAVLKGLEVLPEGFEYAEETPMSRAAFVQALTTLVYKKEEIHSFETVSYFHDVAVSREDAPEIAAAYRKGIISSNDDKLFYPERNITLDEAVTMLMRALGYEDIAVSRGGYPQGYMMCAVQTEILNHTLAGAKETVTQAQMLNLFYHALEAPLVEDAYYGLSDYGNTYTIGEETILSVKDCYKDKGVVTANSVMALNGEQTVGEGQVRIHSETYQTRNGEETLFGFMIEYYYRYDKNTGTKTILYAQQYSDKNKVVEFEADAIVSASKTQYSYYDSDDRQKYMNLAADVDFFYNNQPMLEYTDTLLKPRRGSIKLIDNNGDNRAEVALIEAREVIIVKTVINDVIIDFYDNEKSIDLSDGKFTEYHIKSVSGEEMELQDIKEWSVLLVKQYIDPDTQKTVYDITVNYQVESGVISDVKTMGDKKQKIVSIDVDSRGFYSKQYPVSELVPQTDVLKLKAGLNIKFCVDTDGEIVVLKEIASTYRFAYLFNAYVDENTQQLSLRMYTDSAAFETFLCKDEKFIVDAHTYDSYDMEQMKEIINNSLIISGDNAETDNSGHMIRFKVNSKNEVTEIDTLTQSPDEAVTVPGATTAFNGMRQVKSQYSQRYKSTAMTFGGVYNINENTIVFQIPEDTSEKSFFKVLDKSYFKNDTSYKATAYYTEYDQLRAPLIVLFGSKGAALSNEEPAILVDIAQGANKDGEAGYILSLQKRSGVVEYFAGANTKFSEKNIEKFDVVRFSLDLNSNIGYIEKTFDYSEKKLYKNDEPISYRYYGASENYSYTDSIMFVASQVKKRKDDVVLMDVNPSYASLTNVSFILNNAVIFKKEEERGKETIVKGSQMDIFAQDEYPQNASSMFVFMQYGEARWAYVIND